MARFGVDPALGLGPDAVEAARRRFGGNVLDVGGRRSAVAVLVEQFKSVLVALLAVAAGLSAYFGQVAEAVAVFRFSRRIITTIISASATTVIAPPMRITVIAARE